MEGAGIQDHGSCRSALNAFPHTGDRRRNFACNSAFIMDREIRLAEIANAVSAPAAAFFKALPREPVLAWDRDEERTTESHSVADDQGEPVQRETKSTSLIRPALARKRSR